MIKIKNDGEFIVTKRCVHSKTNLQPNCNIKNKDKYKVLTKDQINNNLIKYSKLKKCEWCLSGEDIEIID